MTREVPPIGSVVKGAGIYGVPAPTHVTECRHSHNPHGHNPVCGCGWKDQADRFVAGLGSAVADKDRLLSWLKAHA